MSEELLQTVPVEFGRYQYLNLGETTLEQLERAGLVSRSDQRALARKKPDGLLTLGDGDVRAVIEYKRPEKLRTRAQIEDAIKQELEVAKAVCNLLIVTDGKRTFWVNPHTGNRILSENGHPLTEVFDAKSVIAGTVPARDLQRITEIVDKSATSLDDGNDQLRTPNLIDPSGLARSLWQRIWVNTGKEPEKCLYNVVELFVFKFLSDTAVLGPHESFEHVSALFDERGAADALHYYASISRKSILRLFPPGADGTTIINGTIFVNEKEEANQSQAHLFGEVLEQLQQYSDQHGSFRFIKHEFKTRLYESFLRQQAGIKALGQYFTPRNVVQAVVEMAKAKQLSPGSRVCDPFCGVGGFLLEAIMANDFLLEQYRPHQQRINPIIDVVGFDKGSDEKDDERTIILAKANMLIYFSDLLSLYNTPTLLREFSNKVFNRVFRLIRSNLGTFGIQEEEPFDLILTNPPYVTSGSQSLKRAIAAQGLASFYGSAGRGTEALALHWITRNLKPGGEAYVIVPDGLLNQRLALENLARDCLVRAIVALPSRTFYSTPKKTYVLALQRKAADEPQSDPVFTYLVSEIGESRDTYRWDIERNDLPEMAVGYRQFRAAPAAYVPTAARCKVMALSELSDAGHWMVDRLWSKSEKESLGIVEEASTVTLEEFESLIEEAAAFLRQAKLG